MNLRIFNDKHNINSYVILQITLNSEYDRQEGDRYG